MIKTKREEKLKAQPLDIKKLEHIRHHVGTSLLDNPLEMPYFFDIEIDALELEENGELIDLFLGNYSKAQFVDPLMEPPIHDLENSLAHIVQELISNDAWNNFQKLSRIRKSIDSPAEGDAFWREVKPLSVEVGASPILLVSQFTEQRISKNLLYAQDNATKDLKIETHPDCAGKQFYISTINEVHVFGSNIPPKQAWLFSSRILARVSFFKLDSTQGYIDLIYRLNDDTIAPLQIQVRRNLEWADLPIFEIHLPDPEE